MNDDRFEFEKLSRPSVWLNLVGRGSKWRAGVGYLPPTSASALKTGKTGVLGADGEPEISPQGRKLTDEEKAKIAKTDQEMIDKEKAERTERKGGKKAEKLAEKTTPQRPYVDLSVSDFNFDTKPVAQGKNLRESDFVYSDNAGFYVIKEPLKSGSFSYNLYRKGATSSARVAQIGYKEPEKVRDYVTSQINRAIDKYWDDDRGIMSEFKQGK